MNIREFTKTYAMFRDLNEAEAIRIKNSSECRKFVQKNLDRVSSAILIKVMANCIYDLTGDTVFKEKVFTALDRKDKYEYREPYPNKYNSCIDNGFEMLECPACRCRIQAVMFSYAVGNNGYKYCPYCGTDVRRFNDESIN